MNLLYFPKEIILVIMQLFTDFNCNIFNAMLTCKDFNSTIKLAIRKIENRSRLKDEQLCEFINITSLNLSCNNTITDCSLKCLTNITSLNLSYNKIITDDSLKCLVNITSLNLYNNKVITDSSLKCLVNITSLNLSCNEIITDNSLK